MFRPLYLAAIVLVVAGSVFGQLPPPCCLRLRRAPPRRRARRTWSRCNIRTATWSTSSALYETLTGKKLIMDNFVQGKVNIFIAKPIPREEAIKIIEINLLLNKYSLVPAGGDFVKVIGTGQNPRGAGVPDHLR